MNQIKNYWVKKWKYENCKRVGNNSALREEHGCEMIETSECAGCIYWFPIYEYNDIADEAYHGELSD